jgi:hypothetical protein
MPDNRDFLHEYAKNPQVQQAPRSFALLIPTQNPRHILPALVAFLWNDASQSPCPGCQNPLMPRKRLRYSRDDTGKHACFEIAPGFFIE